MKATNAMNLKILSNVQGYLDQARKKSFSFKFDQSAGKVIASVSNTWILQKIAITKNLAFIDNKIIFTILTLFR